MRVLELWRYPVKSMAGERVDATTVGDRGLHGDRLWAIRDEDRGIITSAKKFPLLLQCSARFEIEPSPDVGPGAIPAVAITCPDGRTISSGDPDANVRLSDLLGHRVTLSDLRPASDKAHYRGITGTAAERRAAFGILDGEANPDFSMLPMTKLLELGTYATPPGTYFDAMELHVVTTASLAALRAKSGADFDVRRFRPNIVVECADAGLPELTWTGGTLALGTAEAIVDCETPRCSVPIRAQAELPADPRILRTIVEEADRCFGAYATVTRHGAVRIGDAVHLTPPETTKLGDWARTKAQDLKRAILRAALPK